MHKHRGFALMTVLLVGAVLLASAFMFAKAIGTEQYIGQTSEYFGLALDMSEAGVTRAIQDLRLERSAGVVGGSYLKPEDFNALVAETTPVDLDEVVYSELTTMRKVGTYHVTVTRNGTIIKLSNNAYQMTVTVESEGRVYPSNVTLTEPMTATNYQSRRFVGVDVKVVYGGPTVTPDLLKLAAFCDGDMKLSGGATIRGGDVYSNTTITFKGSSGIVDGFASAKNGVTGGPGTTTGYEIPFPPIDLPKLRQLGWAFVNGTYPYDGSSTQIDPWKPVGPNNSYPSTLPNGESWSSDFQTALTALRLAYQLDSSGYHYLTSSSFDGAVSTFITKVQALMKANETMPGNLLDTAVFYFKGNVSQTQDTTDWHAGTFVIDGNLKLTGKSTNDVSGVVPAVYVTGSIDIEGNPGTRFKGLFVAGTSFSITSNASVKGAVWSGGTLTFGGNDNQSSPPAKIIYDSSVGNIRITHYTEAGVVTASPVDGTWKELPN